VLQHMEVALTHREYLIVPVPAALALRILNEIVLRLKNE